MSRLLFSIEVPVGPDWRNVELLRTSVLNCVAAVFQDHDFCQTVGMIAGELLENAIKYGDWTAFRSAGERGGLQRCRLHVSGDGRGVEVAVSNPVSKEAAAAVLDTLDRLSRAGSPQEAYLARLQEIASGRGVPGVSRLGLLRIAYEGDCSIKAEVDADQVLHLTAIARVPGDGD